MTVRTLTPCILLSLSRKDLDAALGEAADLNEQFKKAVAEYFERRSMVNRYGERNIDLVSGFAENIEIPETFVDYSAKPREYPLSTVQTIVRVHTRVSDLYNDPYDQLEQQMRLTIEGIKERQEWELVNSQKIRVAPFGGPVDADQRRATGRRRRTTSTSCWRGCGRSRLSFCASQGDRGFRA